MLEEDNANLRMALRDCIRYVDCDNLTMQTKRHNWTKVANGGKWNRGNVEITTGSEKP